MTKVDPTKIHCLRLSVKQPGPIRRRVAMFWMFVGASIYDAAEQFMLKGFDFNVVEEVFGEDEE